MKMRFWMVAVVLVISGLWTGKVFSQNLDINDQSGQVNDTVSFTVSINNASNSLESMQFDISYDSSVLDYTDNFTKGSLVSGFTYFDVRETSSGQIRIAGITTSALSAGVSGEVVKLAFTVKSCSDITLTPINLEDDLSGWSTGNGKFSCTSSQTPTPTPAATVSPTPVTTPGEPGIIVGTVVDINGNPVSGATVSTNTGGHSATTGADGGYTITGVASGTYTLTASAAGYDSSSQTVTVVAGGTGVADFTLTPSTITPPPPPTACEPESISVDTTTLTLKRKKSGTVTVTVTGEDGCAVEGETVTATISAAGKRRISISPTSDTTDENGQATFWITAKVKTGNARVTFKVGSVKKSMTVKVRK